MTYDILPWDAAGYTWIERQDGTGLMKWVSLQSNSLPTMAAQSDLSIAGTITSGSNPTAEATRTASFQR